MTGLSDVDACRVPGAPRTVAARARVGARAGAAPEPALASKSYFKNRVWLVLLPVVLYAAALNPFFLPAAYDDIIYHFGALSLAAEGSFKFCGKYIVDWPPGVSVLIAVPFWLGWRSVLAAKVCVVVCVAAGLFSGFRLFQKEKRANPTLTFALFALLPMSFLMGTRTMSEWPYFLASMLFLHALRKLRPSDAGLLAAVGAGLLLGAASLTKFTGVLLGTAVVAQMTEKWVQARNKAWFRNTLPEVITALIGAGCFLAWKLKIEWQLAAGTASPSSYYQAGWFPHMNNFKPFGVLGKITDLLFHTNAGMAVLGWQGWWTTLIVAVPGLVVLAGLVLRLRSRERTPADWYALSLLVLFSLVGRNQQTRYLMPVAPFLISYGLVACRHWSQSLARRIPWREVWPARLAVAGYFILLLGGAVQLLVAGNLTGNYRGLCYWITRTPESFYRGYWLDLYRVCQAVRNDATPGTVAIIGADAKFVTAFTERHWVQFGPSEDFVFLLVTDGTKAVRELLPDSKLECLRSAGRVALYKRSAAGQSQPHTPP